jgi:hypothetical protein
LRRTLAVPVIKQKGRLAAAVPIRHARVSSDARGGDLFLAAAHDETEYAEPTGKQRKRGR